MTDPRATIFPAILRIRMPEQLPAALDQAAAQRQTTRSEFVRQALIDRLRDTVSTPLPREECGMSDEIVSAEQPFRCD